MSERKCVMISSTARDLPEHRKQIVEACLRQSMFPLRMEDLPANSDEAVAASLKMVDEADIYIGVFAHRYGYVPKANNPTQISVTEMEYNRAVECKIPRCIFVMDEDHPIKINDVDIENAAKLKSFKGRVQIDNIVSSFKSPDELRAHVINSLARIQESQFTAIIATLSQYSLMRSEEIAVWQERPQESKLPPSLLWQIARCAKCKRLFTIRRTKHKITYSHYYQKCPNSGYSVNSEKLHPEVTDLVSRLSMLTEEEKRQIAEQSLASQCDKVSRKALLEETLEHLELSSEILKKTGQLDESRYRKESDRIEKELGAIKVTAPPTLEEYIASLEDMGIAIARIQDVDVWAANNFIRTMFKAIYIMDDHIVSYDLDNDIKAWLQSKGIAVGMIAKPGSSLKNKKTQSRTQTSARTRRARTTDATV